MSSFKEICKALLDEIPYESPTTCLAREALLNHVDEKVEQMIAYLDGESKRRASELWDEVVRVKVPVPVSEKPWERPGWCDKRGRCWWSNGGVARAGAEINFNAELPMSWWLVRTPESCITGRMLPFDAIPSFDRNDETGGE